MVDEIDQITELSQLETDCLVRNVRANADIPQGVPGTCRECFAFSKRLIGGRCAPCRDGA